jgi:hypothetical protein
MALVVPAVASADNGPTLSRISYGFMINGAGQALWPNSMPESPFAVAQAVGASGSNFVRIGQPANNSETGLPDSSNAPYVSALTQQNIKVGVALSAANRDTGLPRPDIDIVNQGNSMWVADGTQAASPQPTCRNASGAGTRCFSWLFLDHSGQLAHADQQFVVAYLEAIGWHVMTNDSPYDPGNPGSNVPATGAWAHARKFDLISGSDWIQRAHNVVFNGANAVTQTDRDYISQMKNAELAAGNPLPGGVILKPEASSETSKLARLPLYWQCTLLTKWANQQGTYGYHMIFPLFAPTDGVQVAYDSYNRGDSIYNPNCGSLTNQEPNWNGGNTAYNGDTWTYDKQKNLIGQTG